MSLQRLGQCESIADDHKFERRLTLEEAFVVQAGLLEEACVMWTDLGERKVGRQRWHYPGSIADDHKFERRLTLEEAFVVQAGLLEEACVMRTGPLEDAVASQADLGDHKMIPQRWDYSGSLVKDRNFERRLPVKEFFVLLLLLAALAIRILLG